jgi:hypothetical protein
MVRYRAYQYRLRSWIPGSPLSRKWLRHLSPGMTKKLATGVPDEKTPVACHAATRYPIGTAT